MTSFRLFQLWGRRAAVVAGAVAVLAGVSGVNPSPAAAIGGFQNGFETPVVAPNTFMAFFAGEQMGAWTVTRGDVHLIGAGFWQAVDGVQSLDLDGGQQGTIAASFVTVPLATYKVSYWLAGNPVAGPTIKTGQVFINGLPAQSFSFDITGRTLANMGYVQRSFLFLTLTHSVTIEFASTTTPSGWGPALDNVVVQSCLLVLCPAGAAVTQVGPAPDGVALPATGDGNRLTRASAQVR